MRSSASKSGWLESPASLGKHNKKGGPDTSPRAYGCQPYKSANNLAIISLSGVKGSFAAVPAETYAICQSQPVEAVFTCAVEAIAPHCFRIQSYNKEILTRN